jgi:hypothetical protein
MVERLPMYSSQLYMNRRTRLMIIYVDSTHRTYHSTRNFYFCIDIPSYDMSCGLFFNTVYKHRCTRIRIHVCMYTYLSIMSIRMYVETKWRVTNAIIHHSHFLHTHTNQMKVNIPILFFVSLVLISFGLVGQCPWLFVNLASMFFLAGLTRSHAAYDNQRSYSFTVHRTILVDVLVVPATIDIHIDWFTYIQRVRRSRLMASFT